MMKTLEANKLSQALKELKAVPGLTDEDVETLPPHIRAADKNMYHVILIRRVHDSSRQTYSSLISVQQYNERAFEKLKDSVLQLGYYKAIVLHNPSVMIEQSDEDRFNVNQATKAELIAFAKKNGIDLDQNMKAYDMKAAVYNWINSDCDK